MPARASRAGVALVLFGIAVLFTGVVAQLAVTDGAAEVVWVLVSVTGGVLLAIGIAVLTRRRPTPEE